MIHYQMKQLLHEIKLLLIGVFFGCLFIPAFLWFLNLKHGIHIAGLTSPSVYSFYWDFFTGLHNSLVWPLLLLPYLLHSLIRLLFRSSDRGVAATALLEQATLTGHIETIKSLIAQGNDINARNTQGQAPLHLAAAKGDSDMIELLLDSGAEVDAVATDSGYTCLHYAASMGHVESCELLIRRGADTDALTFRQETPLHLAIARGHSNVVALLLKYHARLDIRDKNGVTPLRLAEAGRKGEIVIMIQHHLNDVWPYLINSRG